MTFSAAAALSAINGEIGSTNSPQVSSHIGKNLHVDAVANRYAVFPDHAESGNQEMQNVNFAIFGLQWRGIGLAECRLNACVSLVLQ